MSTDIAQVTEADIAQVTEADIAQVTEADIAQVTEAVITQFTVSDMQIATTIFGCEHTIKFGNDNLELNIGFNDCTDDVAADVHADASSDVGTRTGVGAIINELTGRYFVKTFSDGKEELVYINTTSEGADENYVCMHVPTRNDNVVIMATVFMTGIEFEIRQVTPAQVSPVGDERANYTDLYMAFTSELKAIFESNESLNQLEIYKWIMAADYHYSDCRSRTNTATLGYSINDAVRQYLLSNYKQKFDYNFMIEPICFPLESFTYLPAVFIAHLAIVKEHLLALCGIDIL